MQLKPGDSLHMVCAEPVRGCRRPRWRTMLRLGDESEAALVLWVDIGNRLNCWWLRSRTGAGDLGFTDSSRKDGAWRAAW